MKTQTDLEALLSHKEAKALKLLVGTSINETISASALAWQMWPDEVKGRSQRQRGGLYRAAGGVYQKLQKKGLCSYWWTECSSGYFITQKGIDGLAKYQSTFASW